MALRSTHSLRIAAAASLLFGSAALIGPVVAAGAQTGCGEYSFGFEGTRLLNDGISNSAGPFQIDLPAGTYTVTTQSFDDHAAHPGQFEQTSERWFFVLDSDYVSPMTSDIPDDSNFVTDTFENQTIEATSSILLQHVGEGGVNSVSPLCVGFTLVSPVVEEVPVAEIVEDTPVYDDPPAREVVTPQPDPVEEPAAEPNQPTEAVVEEEVVDIVVGGVQVTDPTPPASPTTTVEVVAVIDDVVPEAVEGGALRAEPQLALTGPSAQTWTFIIGGMALLASGAGLLFEERRRLTH